MAISPENNLQYNRYEHAAALGEKFDNSLLQLLPQNREPHSTNPTVSIAALENDPSYFAMAIMAKPRYNSQKSFQPEDLQYVGLFSKGPQAQPLHIELNRTSYDTRDRTHMDSRIWLGNSSLFNRSHEDMSIDGLRKVMERPTVTSRLPGLIDLLGISSAAYASESLLHGRPVDGILKRKRIENRISNVQATLRRVTEAANSVEPSTVSHVEAKYSPILISRVFSAIGTIILSSESQKSHHTGNRTFGSYPIDHTNLPEIKPYKTTQDIEPKKVKSYEYDSLIFSSKGMERYGRRANSVKRKELSVWLQTIIENQRPRET